MSNPFVLKYFGAIFIQIVDRLKLLVLFLRLRHLIIWEFIDNATEDYEELEKCFRINVFNLKYIEISEIEN